VALAFYAAPLFWYRFAAESLWPLMFTMATHFVLAFPVRKGCDAWFCRGLSATRIDGRLSHRPSV
jgi:hypothetical protein